MTVFATLGPAGTNHELVTRLYLAHHGLDAARIVLVGDFAEAVAALRAGTVDHIVQCAVHPETPRTLGKNFRDVFAIDSFVAPGKPLAILTRSDVETPRSIALVSPATDSYADLGRWERRCPEVSIPVIVEKLLSGAYDSGLVHLEAATRHPGRFRVEEVIGAPDDVWIVYGRERLCTDGILARADGPAAALYRRPARP